MEGNAACENRIRERRWRIMMNWFKNMQPRTRMGLITGVIGLILNIFVVGFSGCCGPLVYLVAGGAAGFLAAKQEKLPVRNVGARAGAVAGVIAGGLIVLGQIIGVALAYFQTSGTSGSVSVSGDAGVALCLGGVGALTAAFAGAVAG